MIGVRAPDLPAPRFRLAGLGAQPGLSPRPSCGSDFRIARLGRRGPSPATSCGSHCILRGGFGRGAEPPAGRPRVRAREVVAKRYAKALFMAAREAGSAVPVGEELEAFQQVFAAHPEVRDVLSRPWIKAVDRRDIAVPVAERSGAGRLVRDFAGLVAERGRIDHLPEIVAAYLALVDEDLGQARARVRSAVALAPEDRRRLGARLEQILGKRIILEEQVDDTLLGGFIAQVGSFILDGSLDGQLERMRERLAKG